MKNLKVVVMLLGIVGVSSVASAGLFAENFDSYTAGSQIIGQGGWKGWDSSAAAGAWVSSAMAVSPSNSVEIVATSDLVHEFAFSGGKLEVSAMQFLPANATGSTYFILLNRYIDGGPDAWSVQMKCDMDAGQVISENGNNATLPLVKDQWVQLLIDIDLDSNIVNEYYNGSLLSTHAWYDTADANAGASLQAVDLFGNNASSVYYDNLNIVPEPATLSLLGLGALALIRKRG